MKPAAFAYARPDTPAEALAVLAEWGDEATLLAGGLSLGPMLNMRLARPAVVVDINGLAELDNLSIVDGRLRTGALVRQADALAAPEIAAAVPLLARALRHVGHHQTRSRGTLAGSVAHADPSAEIPLCLATLGGEIELASARGRRRVAARDFAAAALTTDRAADEMIWALIWPTDVRPMGTAFAEVRERHGDFAIVAAAAHARANGGEIEVSLGLAGVEDRPLVWHRTAPVSGGEARDFGRDLAQDAAAGLEPMADPRAGADFRRHLAAHLGARVVAEAVTELLARPAP